MAKHDSSHLQNGNSVPWTKGASPMCRQNVNKETQITYRLVSECAFPLTLVKTEGEVKTGNRTSDSRGHSLHSALVGHLSRSSKEKASEWNRAIEGLYLLQELLSLSGRGDEAFGGPKWERFSTGTRRRQTRFVLIHSSSPLPRIANLAVSE
jgi:hypothetical protein